MPSGNTRRIALVALAAGLAACNPGAPPDSTTGQAASAPVVASTPAVAPVPAPDTATMLVAYQWQLATASDPAGQVLAAFFPSTDQPLGIVVSDGRLSVTGSCNRISAGFQMLDGERMRVSAGASTMMACPQPLADADAAMAAFLNGILQLAIVDEADAPQLRLTAADGSVLSFHGTPTPETRFGQPGVRAFLEVSPQPCEASSASTCLLVRDRAFDESGLPSGTPGEWRELPEGIEGYTRVDGQQQVVRVKRFAKAGAEGSPPTEHFVFDLTIESRTVD